MSSEFLDAYSDDQIFLQMLERLVAEHPVESLSPKKIKYSSYCRVWSVMAVGAIEAMIKTWNDDEVMWRDIYSYFDEKISNEERLERLKKAFNLRGFKVDDTAFSDFLAMKYIRNTYVHGEWKNNQRKFVVSCGFPSDTVSFDKNHFEKMKMAYFHVMNGIGMMKAMHAAIRSELKM